MLVLLPSMVLWLSRAGVIQPDRQEVPSKTLTYNEFVVLLQRHYQNASLASTDRQVFLIQRLIKDLDGKVVDLTASPPPCLSIQKGEFQNLWEFYTVAYPKDAMWADMSSAENKDKPNTYKRKSRSKKGPVQIRKARLA